MSQADACLKKCPGPGVADRLSPAMGEIVRGYHAHVWAGGGAIPLKVKYLMALATAVTGREKQRALLEATKALKHGATDEEIRETLELAVWLGGSPLLLEVVDPVLRLVEKAAAKNE